MSAPTGIEAIVCEDIASRQAVGIAKYGVTVADNPLSLREWLTHAYQECLDQAVYLRRAITELELSEKQGDISDKPSRIKLDPARIESRKRLEQMHPADRFKAMFGLTSGLIQGHERTEADELAEQSRHRCNNLTDEERAELLKEGLLMISEPLEETNGTRIARENRTACNDLTKEDRAELLDVAMQTIRGTTPSNLPASQPTCDHPGPGK